MASSAAEREDLLADVLENIADACGVEAEVEVTTDEHGLYGEYVGDDASELIGSQGSTLDAIQHVAYRIVFRGERERHPLTVDADGYRDERAEALQALGDQAAEAAIRDGKPVSLEPMTALERKVVHEHLKSRRNVETYSEGEEPSRRLVVAPLVS